MYASPNVNPPQQAYSGGGAAHHFAPSGGPSRLVGITAKTLTGVPLERDVGGITYSRSGDLRTSQGDAHPRSEAAFPIVKSFAAVVKAPNQAKGSASYTLQKGAPIAFLPAQHGSNNDPTLVSLKLAPSNASRFATEDIVVAYVGGSAALDSKAYKYGNTDAPRNSKGELVPFGRAVLGFLAEQVHITNAKPNDLVPIAAVLEHQCTVQPTQQFAGQSHSVAAGSPVMAGIHAQYGAGKGDPRQAPDTFSVEAYAGYSEDMQKIIANSAEDRTAFVGLKTGTVLVPSAAQTSPVQAVVHARKPPSMQGV